MKKIILLFILTIALSNVQSQGIYFQAQVKKSASGSSLEFYIRPNPTGSNITLKFDNLDFFVRWPSTEAAPLTGTPVVNTVDFPGLTIAQQNVDNPYGNDAGFVVREWASPTASSTNTVVTYVAGQEYLVFSVPVSNVISNNIELSGNNEFLNAPYYFTATKNISGVGGQSDHTSHNSFNGNNNNQLFYGSSGSLSEMTTTDNTKNFYQKITAGVLPVKFTSFTAVKKLKDAVLSWTVVNETAEVDHYLVERSLNGTTFNTINSFPKAGTSTNENVYNYLDRDISLLKSNGIIYYRIKQVDVDGRFVYSTIKNVKNADKGLSISVFPNPVKEITTLLLETPANMLVPYKLINSQGITIQRNYIQAVKGLNTKRISMNNCAAGNYLLSVIVDNKLQTLKIVKE